MQLTLLKVLLIHLGAYIKAKSGGLSSHFFLYRRNSPDTTVYNQCSNKMLEYAVKKQTDFGWMNNLEDITTTENLPPPPTSQDVDCIISGFPWYALIVESHLWIFNYFSYPQSQSHSSLNQNKGTSASQALNELLLNTLSWVDLIRPNYVLFENVKGFVEHEVAAVRVSRYVTRGGIKRGGIKLLCRALICMGYGCNIVASLVNISSTKVK